MAVIKSTAESSWRGRGGGRVARRLGRVSPTGEAEVGTEAGTSAAYCLAPHGLFKLLSYTTQDNQLSGGTIYSGLVHPTINH